MIPPTPAAQPVVERGTVPRAAVVALVALAVAVPGMLMIVLWPRGERPMRASQAPGAPVHADATVGRPHPLSGFDLREVSRAPTRIKIWVTPPRSPSAYGLEFEGSGASVRAIVTHRGSAERTTVPLVGSWVDRLNGAIRGTAETSPESVARRMQGGLSADMVIERAGEIPEKYEVRFDPEGPAWAVLDEILSHYGLVSYTVKKGDTPAKIAQKLLGDSRRWPEIMAVNPGLKPDKLQPDDVIFVPKR